MKVLITGSSGLIGSSLIPFLAKGGHHVTRLVRARPKPDGDEVRWDPEKSEVENKEIRLKSFLSGEVGEVAAGRKTGRKGKEEEKERREKRNIASSFTVIKNIVIKICKPLTVPKSFCCSRILNHES